VCFVGGVGVTGAGVSVFVCCVGKATGASALDFRFGIRFFLFEASLRLGKWWILVGFEVLNFVRVQFFLCYSK